jgi:predicted ester cyclase
MANISVRHLHNVVFGLAVMFVFLPLQAQAGSRSAHALSEAEATAIVAPLYDALNEPAKKDVVKLLAQATNSDYRSCSTNQDCLDRDKLAEQFKYFGSIIPDLHWKVIDLWTSGNRIVVRGEATGTPMAPLFGVAPSGRSFRTISVDMFTVKNGKLSTAYHVENWTAAMEQIKQP